MRALLFAKRVVFFTKKYKKLINKRKNTEKL